MPYCRGEQITVYLHLLYSLVELSLLPSGISFNVKVLVKSGRSAAMGNKKLRFTLGIAIVIAALIFFAVSGFQEGKAYYKTIEELRQMGASAYGKHLKVAGIVAEESIQRNGRELTFQIKQDDLRLSVRYTGDAPVPDTFKGGIETVLEGSYDRDGIFEAKKIQAKCASKYKAKYGTASAESP
jgi:cytochrome c-type biogenesis protein CcmE